MTEATSNAKQVYYLLVEFDQDYGRFPSDATAVGELAEYRGEYANDYLGQLIAAEYTKSEEIFYAEGGAKTNKKPDSVIISKEDVLCPGENGFAYVCGLSTNSNAGRPVLLTPMTGDGVKFSSKPHKGKAVVLRVDGSVKQLLIDEETSRAKIGDGKTLFQEGPESVWGEDGFDEKMIVYPE